MANKKSDTLELSLYGTIDPLWGDVSAVTVRDAIKAAGNAKTIHVRVNSPGGSVFDSVAIHSLLRSHPARKLVTVDGLAASAASIVMMAGDDIEIATGGFVFVHDPLGYVQGDAAEMRDMAGLLERMKGQLVGIYARRTGRTEADIVRMMAEETWMSAEEAVRRSRDDVPNDFRRAVGHGERS
jgi:ATP-dependent Clp protease, protease subunit